MTKYKSYNKSITAFLMFRQYGEIFSSRLLYCPSLRSGQYCQPQTEYFPILPSQSCSNIYLLCGFNQYTLLQNRDNSGLLGTPMYSSLKLGGDAPPMLRLGGRPPPPPPAPPVEPPLPYSVQANLISYIYNEPECKTWFAISCKGREMA